jgi:galactoside O-acetyltransferase
MFLYRRSSGTFFANCDKTAKIARNKIYFQENTQLFVGALSIVEAAIHFEKQDASVSIGGRTFIGGSSILCSEKISIGDDVLISFGVTIVDHDSHSVDFSYRKNDVCAWYRGEKDWTYVIRRPVVIEDKSWVGMHVIILKGVTIGEGAVVAAGSVVTKDVPPYTVVAGNPARVIRRLDMDVCDA